MRNPREEDVSWTDWSSLTVGQMWDALGDFDHEPASEQSGGWSRAFELLDYHRARLEEYRDLVAGTWRGATANAFVAQVNGLIGAVTTLRDAAIANDAVLPHLSASMVEARAKLEPIYRQWSANQTALAGGQQPVPTWSMPHPSAGVPAVSPGAQEQLHVQAVAVMSTLSSQAIEGYRAVQIPPSYRLQLRSDPQPPSHAALPAGSASSGSGGPLRHAPVSPVLASIPNRTMDPALAGGPATSTVPRPGSSVPAPAVFTSAGPQPVVGRIIGIAPLGNRIEIVPSGQSVSTGSALRPGNWALPPGGVINGPMEDIEPKRPATGVPRVNPVGGVIGPQTGRETEGMFAPPVGGAGGGLGDQRQQARNRNYDTDEHWPRPTGVPPVIMPRADEPIHDPGPAIGLPRKRRDR